MTSPPPLKVLVPIDFSPASQAALAVALDGAAHRAWSLALIHVVDKPGAPLSRAEARLDAVALEVPDGVGAVEGHVVIGRPADEICVLADELRADLILVGTHGRNTLRRLLLGSVAAELVRRAPCPVLCVRPDGERSELGRWRRLLCAVDFSPTSRRAVDAAIVLARRLALELVLVHVCAPPVSSAYEPLLSADALEQLEAGSQRALAEWKEAAERDGVHARTEVAIGTPAEKIVAAARDDQCDLIVVGTQGRTGLARLALGSVTDRVIQTARCPVLTVHPPTPTAVHDAA